MQQFSFIHSFKDCGGLKTHKSGNMADTIFGAQIYILLQQN